MEHELESKIANITDELNKKVSDEKMTKVEKDVRSLPSKEYVDQRFTLADENLRHLSQYSKLNYATKDEFMEALNSKIKKIEKDVKREMKLTEDGVRKPLSIHKDRLEKHDRNLLELER